MICWRRECDLSYRDESFMLKNIFPTPRFCTSGGIEMVYPRHSFHIVHFDFSSLAPGCNRLALVNH